MKTHAHKLDSRELATVLAVLRYYANDMEIACLSADVDPDGAFRDIATDGGSFGALDSDEVNALCERLNLVGMPCALTDDLPKKMALGPNKQ